MDRNTALEACKTALACYEVTEKKEHFDTLESECYRCHCDTWQRANQIDSYLRFAEVATAAFAGIDGGYDWYRLFQPLRQDFWRFSCQDLPAGGGADPCGQWVDDYGWHGIACIGIARQLKKSAQPPTGNDYDDWLKWGLHAVQCYQRMQQSWDDLQRREPDAWPVKGGLSNAPRDPQGEIYVRNTVTNALFMLLCLKLYEFLKNEGSELDPDGKIRYSALKQAVRQALYFRDWMYVDSESQSYRYFNKDVNSGVITGYIIEERPVAKPPNNFYPELVKKPFSFTQECFWSGDQGLMINAFASMQMNSADIKQSLCPDFINEGDLWLLQTNSYNGISHLLKKTSDLLAPSDGDGVLREGPFDNFYNTDPGDYVSGRGVLARRINDKQTQAFLRSHDTFRDLLSTWNTIFEKTALAIHSNPPDPGTSAYSADWNIAGNRAAFEKFYRRYGNGNVNIKGWQPPGGPAFTNFCCMNVFDVYAAYVQSRFA